MKKYLSLLLIFAIAPLQAEDLTTRDGKVYHDYKVLGHDTGYLTILYSDGGGKIPLSNLSDEMQKKYGYDKAAADAFVKASTLADRQAREAIVAERKEAAEKKAAALAVQATGSPQTTTPSPPPPAEIAPAPASNAPTTLTPSEIDAIHAKIKELKDDIAFMQRQEAKAQAINKTGDVPTASVVSHGAYADKIDDDTKEMEKLERQLGQP